MQYNSIISTKFLFYTYSFGFLGERIQTLAAEGRHTNKQPIKTLSWTLRLFVLAVYPCDITQPQESGSVLRENRSLTQL